MFASSGGDISQVLILRAIGLGDFLTGVPAYRGLRQAFPEARITLAAPAVLEPLALLTGAIDRIVPVNGLASSRRYSRRPTSLSTCTAQARKASGTYSQPVRAG